MRMIITFITVFFMQLSVAQAESWSARSQDHQVAVMELFTSEGCGLCPPADRWVQQLPELGVTADQLIVLGYHIDYLNVQKGWIDRFAKPEFSARQRQLAKLNLFQTVFTPEFFISGEVVHSWREHGVEAIEFVNSFKPEATLNLSATKKAATLDIDAVIDVGGEDNRQHSVLYLALKQDDVISHIDGGDNRGATFNHQDLVRSLYGPYPLEADGSTQLAATINLDESWDVDKLELVAFVQNLSDGYILQGLALPLKQ